MPDNITQWFAGGFERVQWGVIDSSGYFIGTGTTLANGSDSGMGQLQSPNVANVPSSGARTIQPEGGDSIAGRIALPGITEIRFQLGLSVQDLAFKAAAEGTKVYTLEEYDFGMFDPDSPTFQTMCLLFTRKAASSEQANPGSGFEHLLLPSCQVVPQGPGNFQTGENPALYNYEVVVNRATKFPWGQALTLNDQGTLKAGGTDFWSENRVTLHAFKGDGTEDEIIVDYTPVSGTLNTKNFVHTDGVKETTDITITPATKLFDFTAAPSAGETVVIFYEHTLS